MVASSSDITVFGGEIKMPRSAGTLLAHVAAPIALPMPFLSGSQLFDDEQRAGNRFLVFYCDSVVLPVLHEDDGDAGLTVTDGKSIAEVWSAPQILVRAL